MNRADLRLLAADRVVDARILLDQRRWTAAFYLVGYAVETALKACILRYVDNSGIIFLDKNFAAKCWTHSFNILVQQANLEPIRTRDMDSNSALAGNWGVVQDWNEVSRYQQKSEAEARSLYEAVTNDPDGVFRWIQQHW